MSCNVVGPGFRPAICPPQRLEFLTRPRCGCWYGNTLWPARSLYTGITLVLEKKKGVPLSKTLSNRILHTFKQQQIA